MFNAPVAHAANPVPYPAALAGHPFAKQWTLQEMSTAPWTTPGNDPGNCPANPSAVSLVNNSYVQLNANGNPGNCTSIQSPHTYPTTPGYVYEAQIYVSNKANWPAMWAYGDSWPSQGEIDAMEFNDEVNYVSWHYAPCNGQTSSSEKSTNPWSYDCKTNLTPTSQPNFAPNSWVIVDYSFTSTGVDVYYNGQLYVHVPESISQNEAMWLTFSNGSCQGAGGNTCANPGDASQAGNLGIKYFRAFT